MAAVARERHPPRAALVVRIGVTGHRPEKLKGASLQELRLRVREILSLVRETAAAVVSEPDSGYLDARPVLRIVSALAEGADRLVAEEGIAEGCELQAPLPFEREEYLRDFPGSKGEFQSLLERATAVFELDGSRASPTSRNEAYQNAGRMVLRQSDVLIAIWSGDPQSGVGGTAQIVDEALELDIPTVWIGAAPPHEATLRGRSGAEQARDLPISGLRDLLRARLLPPPRPKHRKLSWLRRVGQLISPSSHERPDLRRAYFGERLPLFNWGFLFALFTNLCARLRIGKVKLRLHPISGVASAWREIPDQTRRFLAVHYGWADRLAEHRGGLYRTSFLMSYLLSALAVFFALLDFLGPSFRRFSPVTELVCIVCIVGWTLWGNRGRWHRKWIDYRILAECFRTSAFLVPLGRSLRSFELAPELAPSHPRDLSGTAWVGWHLRTILREAGLPHARADTAYLETCAAAVEGDIRHQIDYHAKTHHTLGRVHRHLRALGFWLFVATFVLCLVHVFWPKVMHVCLSEECSNALSFFSGVLPAFGACFAGLQAQAEFERNAELSEAMCERLEAIPPAEQPVDGSMLAAIGRRAEEAAEVMMGELLDWRNIYRTKVLELPS